MDSWKTRVRAAFARTAAMPDDGVIEELAQHARAMYTAARAEGCSEEEARRRVDVQIELWRADAGVLRHRPRRASVVDAPPRASSSGLSGLSHDIRYSARLLCRQPRYALLVILMMALGIGATTTLFSVTYGVLVKPLPWPAGDRLVVLRETRGGNPPRFGSFTNAAFLAWRDEAKTIDGIAAWSLRLMTLSSAGEPERVRVNAVTASMFPVLGARPLLGAFFTDKDETAAPSVVVLSERLWRQRFGGDPGVLGRAAVLDGRSYTIVGVLPDGLAFPDRQTLAWVPFRVPPPAGNYMSMFGAIARLRPAATEAQAAAEGTGRGKFAADTGMTTTAIFGNRGPIEISARSLHESTTADVRRPILVLLAAVVLLFVTATANVASLQLARATSRRRELAIRAAIGAGTARVTRQLLTENLLLACAGGAAGVGLAVLLHTVAPALLPADFPRVDDVSVGLPGVAFAVIVSLAAGAALAVLPALRARRVNLVESLTDDGAASVGTHRGSRAARARALIMAGQVAIACVLLVGASLLGRSFVAMLGADRGYDPSGVLTARLSMPAAEYPTARRYAIVGQVLDRLAMLPGVSAAGFTSEMPLTPGGSTAAFSMPSTRGEGIVQVQASPRLVSAGAFSALGMRVVEGRGFLDTDTETSQPVVVVNRAFARKYLGSTALGTRVPNSGYTPPGGDDLLWTIVGIVDDVRYVTSTDVSLPEMYYSYRQMRGTLPVSTVTLLLRTDGDPASLGGAIRAAVREADIGLVAEGIVTMEDRVLTTLARPRLYAVLLGGFATLALIVAGVGLFGVLSYTVAQRAREIAVRSALGARRADIVRLVVRQGIVVTLVGTAAGLLASMALTKWISTLLYGVTTRDAVTFVAVPVVLVMISILACVVPARRAAALDPLRVLRGGGV